MSSAISEMDLPAPALMRPLWCANSASRPARRTSMAPPAVARPPPARPSATMVRSSASRTTMSASGPAVARFSTDSWPSCVLKTPSTPAALTLNSACGATRRACVMSTMPAASMDSDVAPQDAPLVMTSVVRTAFWSVISMRSTLSLKSMLRRPLADVSTSAWSFSWMGCVLDTGAMTTRSKPAPPSSFSVPPPLTRKVSLPAPPSMVLVPVVMMKVSSPPLPQMRLSPPPMSTNSAPSPPMKVSLPEPP